LRGADVLANPARPRRILRHGACSHPLLSLAMVLHSDAPPASSTGGLCHMAHTHEFDCQQCNAHFDSREELDRHNQQKHSQQAGSSSNGANQQASSSSSQSSNRNQ
jgi:hypothetical protein